MQMHFVAFFFCIFVAAVTVVFLWQSMDKFVSRAAANDAGAHVDEAPQLPSGESESEDDLKEPEETEGEMGPKPHQHQRHSSVFPVRLKSEVTACGVVHVRSQSAAKHVLHCSMCTLFLGLHLGCMMRHLVSQRGCTRAAPLRPSQGDCVGKLPASTCWAPSNHNHYHYAAPLHSCTIHPPSPSYPRPLGSNEGQQKTPCCFKGGQYT